MINKETPLFLSCPDCCMSLLQSLLVSILAGSGLLAGTQDQKNLSNFLICTEMLPAAIGMLFAFPYIEYKGEAHIPLQALSKPGSW